MLYQLPVCEIRAVQVVETVSQARATAVLPLQEVAGYEGYHVFFATSANEGGVSRILMWKSNCAVVQLKTGKNLDDLKEEDPFDHEDESE